MRTQNWIRLGLSLGAVAAFGAGTLVACSSDDTAGGKKTDAGSDTSPPGTGPDAGTSDTGTTETSTPPVPPSISIVHAANDLGRVAFCFQVNGKFPLAMGKLGTGLGPNQGGNLGLNPTQAGVLPMVDITPIVVLSDGIDPATSCDAIVPNDGGVGDAGVPVSSVITLPTIPKGTFKYGQSYVVALIGCAANETGGAALCGSDYTDAGGSSTVRAVIMQVDGESSPGNDIGLQFIHLSPETQAQIQTGLAAGLLEPDGGAEGGISVVFPIGNGVDYNGRAPAPTPADAAVVAKGALSQPDTNGIQLYGSMNGQPAPTPLVLDSRFESFTTLALTSTGSADAGFFEKGKNYSVIAVGNPNRNVDAGAHSFRLIATKNR